MVIKRPVLKRRKPQHDLSPAFGHCGRCNKPAVSRCYDAGCLDRGVKLCAAHLDEHEARILKTPVS